MRTENVISFSTIKKQVNKKKVTYRLSQWVYPTSPQTEDELFDRETNPDLSYSKIKKQVRKKGVSRKSKKDRISDKLSSLSERVGYKPYK